MITSGRCHGPGCQREAPAGDFCGWKCQSVWNAQFVDDLPGSLTVGDVVGLYESLPKVGLVKLTRGQLDALRHGDPATYVWQASKDGFGYLSGRPVALVAGVSESSLYRQARRPAGGDLPYLDDVVEAIASRQLFTNADAIYPQVASPSPQVAQSDQTRGWLGRWLHRMRRTP
jgi:hypothetical protein